MNLLLWIVYIKALHMNYTLPTSDIQSKKHKEENVTSLTRNINTDFQLEDLRAKLDEKGLAIAERQQASVNSRKKLAELTKGESQS